MSYNNLKFTKWTCTACKLLCAALFSFLVSCSETNSRDDIVGTWYGTRSYYNPAGGTKYQYLTITFEDNWMGSLEYEAPTSYSVAKFTYSVKGNIITCQGAYATTSGDGDFDSDFEMTLEIDSNRLIPKDKYTMFILTKDSSTETDSNGNEVVDDSELIYGVWLHNSGEVVLVLSESQYAEYTLMPDSKKIYSKKTEGTFTYNYRLKYALINGNRFDVTSLSETSLQLKSESNSVFIYTRGSQADIPTNGQNSTDYKALLESPKLGWTGSNSVRALRFYGSNNIYYLEESSKRLGSWGYINLAAKGTYSLSGKIINCIFTDVDWQSGTSYAKDYFPGWTAGQTCYKDFIIESISTETLKLTIDGKSHYLYNADLQ